MSRPTLAARLGLLFAACTAVVSLLAGVLFSRASEAHFLELDQQLLGNRLAALSQVLEGVASPAALPARLPALRQELAHAPDLGLRLLGANGAAWFDERSPAPASAAPLGLTSVHNGAGAFRVLSAPLGSGAEAPVLELWLDITHHQHFLQRMQRLIWLTVGCSALATALLGAWAARQALAPLRRMGEVAASVQATSLTARLPEQAMPAELAEVARTFNAMLERLEGAFERLAGFSADIAHELRTPLTNLLTHTQVTLAQPRALEDYREALHGNLEELQRLGQLVNDMLLLAKADHGLIRPGLQPLALADEAAELLDYYRLLADDAGISLTQHGQAHLAGDRGLLRRALANLLENALRYTPAGGEVRVIIEHTEGVATLAVFNTGPQVPAEQLARLFDRFYRADPARAAAAGSHHAGLGLAITRSIAQAHGGTLTAEAAEGGMAFTLALPAHS
ncbi:heavy metal sensor histidine kinase [Pseudomonas sp. NPDC007930]|uniref:heavy metal sensor histidine kinase n=1 Tax=Pseudomonas sp. NPDC007930 TaxID=3364417 RepID=UPI0036E0D5B8